MDSKSADAWTSSFAALPLIPSGDTPIQVAGRLAFRFMGAYLALGLSFVLVVTRGAPFLRNPDTRWQMSMSQIAMFLILTSGLIFLLARYWFRELIAARREAAHAKIELVHRLAVVAEWKDDTIGGHNYRIARCAQILARELGQSERDQRNIFHGAVLHDIGKVGMPDHLLRKNGRFTPEERKLMERHVLLGAALLDGSQDPLLTVARTIALTHHENWDGSGYPYGLVGADIPLEGRIVAVCDVLDALMSRRPYKEAWDDSEAVRFIVEESGRKFDPLVVDAMIRVLPELLAVREETPTGLWVGAHNGLAVPLGHVVEAEFAFN